MSLDEGRKPSRIQAKINVIREKTFCTWEGGGATSWPRDSASISSGDLLLLEDEQEILSCPRQINHRRMSEYAKKTLSPKARSTGPA